MSRPRRLATALLIAGSITLTQAGLSLAGSGPAVECCQVTAYAGQIDIDTDVAVDLEDASDVPAQPATSTADTEPRSRDSDVPELLLGLIFCLGVIFAASRLSPASRRD